MDRPPSFPPYQNPNPSFHHHRPPPHPNFFLRTPPPLQDHNNHSTAPSPPSIRDLSGTLSSLQSLISECETTLASLSQNLAIDHSSLLGNGGFVRCPFDSNHLMPPEALFLHSLRCPRSLDLTHLLESFTSYRKTLELQCELQHSDGDGGLCTFFTDSGSNFYYNDCPGVVNFSDLNGKKRNLRLPSVVSVECSDFVGSDVKEKKSMVEKWLVILPSDLCAIRSEIDQWREYPSSCSYSVLASILSSESVETSGLSRWVLVNSTRYGVIIDTYMRDHIFLLFRLSMKSVVKEAYGLIEADANEQQIVSSKSRTFDCPVLIQALSWLASQLAVLYGEGNGKFFALDMLKHCIVESASQIMLFRSERTRPESCKVLGDSNYKNVEKSGGEVGGTFDSGQAISVSRVAAAVAALYERSMLEGRIRAIRYAQPLTRYQRAAELALMTAKADEERRGRLSYKPIIDHDGLPRQRSSNQDMNKMKTREELLAEERDYKRRRMSYRGKKVKRTPRQVLRDMIEEFTEEVKLAGGIGCFEKGMPLPSTSSIGNNEPKESDFGYNTASSTLTDTSPRYYRQSKGENYEDIEHPMANRTHIDKGKGYEEYDLGSSQRRQSHRSYKDNDHRDEEFARTKRHSLERKSYHQNHRSSHEKSSSDYYKTKRNDRYDRRSRESRNQDSFEDRYNPIEKE